MSCKCDTCSTFAGIRPDFNRTDLTKFEMKTFPVAGSRIQGKCVSLQETAAARIIIIA